MSPARRRRPRPSCVPYTKEKSRCDKKIPRHNYSKWGGDEESHPGPRHAKSAQQSHGLVGDDLARQLVVLEQKVQRLQEEQARLTRLIAVAHKTPKMASAIPVVQGGGIPVHLVTSPYRLVPSAGGVRARHPQAQAGSSGFLPCQTVPRCWVSDTSQYSRQ
ncbi:hypothetical protein BT69DRAFT_1290705 [Atractiella rhizophila]|nr:hypothetical protein BT69DRAFT_1290705 [Atractiella rhizophila]